MTKPAAHVDDALEELRAKLLLLRDALKARPARWAVQHHAYDRWDREVEAALEATK